MLRLIGLMTISMAVACDGESDDGAGDDDDDAIADADGDADVDGDADADGDADGDADRPACEPLADDPQPTDDCDPGCAAEEACYGARCIPAGGHGQACLSGGRCSHDDLSCFEGRCQSAGIVAALYSAELDEHFAGGSVFRDDVAVARSSGELFVPFESELKAYRASDRCATSLPLDPAMRVASIAVNADGSRLVVSGELDEGEDQLDRYTVLLDGVRGALLAVLTEGCDACRDEAHPRFSADGQHVLAVHREEAFAWDAEGNLIWSDDRGETIRGIDLSPDGATLGLGQRGETGVALHLISLTDPALDTLLQHSYGGTFDDVAFHPDGERVLSLDFSTVTIWNVETGDFSDIPPHALETPLSPHLEAMALSPDGASLALVERAVAVEGQEPIGGPGLHVSIWDLATATQRARFIAHDSIRTLSWLTEPDHLLTYGHDEPHDFVCETDSCSDCEVELVDCTRLPSRQSVKVWNIGAMEIAARPPAE